MGVNGTDVLGLKARKKYVIRGLHQTYEGAGISKPQEVYGFNVPVLDAMGGLDIRFEDKIPVAELIQTARGQFFKEDLKKAVKQAIETPLMIASIANAGRKGVVVTLTKSANLIMQVINVLQSDNPDLEILKYVIGNGQGKILDKFFGDEYIMFSETINQILTKKESEITDDTLKRIRGELGELFDGVEIWKSPQFRKRSFLGIPLRTRNNKVDVTIIYNKKTDVVITAVGCSTMEDRYMFNRIISIYGIHGKDAGRSKEGYYDENHPFGNMQAWYELDLEYYEELKNEKDN
jgi:hypothetical protein